MECRWWSFGMPKGREMSPSEILPYKTPHPLCAAVVHGGCMALRLWLTVHGTAKEYEGLRHDDVSACGRVCSRNSVEWARCPLQLRGRGALRASLNWGRGGVWKTASKRRPLFSSVARKKNGWRTGFAKLMCSITCFSDFRCPAVLVVGPAHGA